MKFQRLMIIGVIAIAAALSAGCGSNATKNAGFIRNYERFSMQSYAMTPAEFKNHDMRVTTLDSHGFMDDLIRIFLMRDSPSNEALFPVH